MKQSLTTLINNLQKNALVESAVVAFDMKHAVVNVSLRMVGLSETTGVYDLQWYPLQDEEIIETITDHVQRLVNALTMGIEADRVNNAETTVVPINGGG